MERLKDLKQGRPLGALPPRAITVSKSPAPKSVTATPEEVITKLKERTDRYRSLLVEYDITTEADVDPQLLVAWQLFDSSGITVNVIASPSWGPSASP